MRLLTTAVAAALLTGGLPVETKAAGLLSLTAQDRNRVTASEVDGAIVAYGTWIQQLQQMQAPLIVAMTRVRDRFRARLEGRSELPFEALGNEVEQVRRAARELAQNVRNLRLPDVTALSLEEELQPTAVQREHLAIIAEMERMSDLLQASVRAMAEGRNEDAVRASEGLINSAQIMLRQSVLFQRAVQAVTPRDESNWDLIGGEIVIHRAMSSIMTVFGPERSDTRQTIVRELLTFANELGTLRRSAEAKLRVETQAADRWLNDSRTSSQDRRLARRAKDVSVLAMRQTELFSEWEGFLRETATGIESTSLPDRNLSIAVLDRLRSLRQRSDILAAELNRVITAP